MIKFGTDGWRAIIAKEFTFENMMVVSQALADVLKEQNKGEITVVVGYDNRFLSEDFAQESANVFSANGINVLMSNQSLPTPALSLAVVKNKAQAGVMITSSHNPPQYSGFKIKEPTGRSSSVEFTNMVEKRAIELLPQRGKIAENTKKNKNTGLIEYFDPKPAYFEQVKKVVDIEELAKSNIDIVVDPMFGSGVGWIKELFEPYKKKITEIRSYRDTMFGGVNPEPIPVNLEYTMEYMKKRKEEKKSSDLSFCIVLDGDADRIGAVDTGGRYINTHEIFALLVMHLVENRKMGGDIVKTFNITQMIDILADKYKRKLYVTPIGFKYVADLMLTDNILIGGEESGGMGVKGHLPERDGIISGLLLAEMVIVKNKNMSQILNEFMDEVGYFYYDRFDLKLQSNEQRDKIMSGLKNNPTKSIADMVVEKTEELDGQKFIFKDGGWILFRPSGTEPLLRIYAEAHQKEIVEKLLDAGKALARS